MIFFQSPVRFQGIQFLKLEKLNYCLNKFESMLQYKKIDEMTFFFRFGIAVQTKREYSFKFFHIIEAAQRNCEFWVHMLAWYWLASQFLRYLFQKFIHFALRKKICHFEQSEKKIRTHKTHSVVFKLLLLYVTRKSQK